MIKIMLYTLLWMSAIYMIQRPALKKANRITRWSSIVLLLGSGTLWVFLRMTVQIPRPADWMEQIFSPFVPVP